MSNYYTQKLSAKRLQRCYIIAPERIKQYQTAETDTVLHRLQQDDFVLDLGCGYGRVFNRLSLQTKNIFGIDISFANLQYAQTKYLKEETFNLAQMNAANLGFAIHTFDLVFCIQNGISAFKEEPVQLIKEALRVTKPGGRILFSSYSDKIWDARLDWFRIQSQKGLIGEIDFAQTMNGTIVCKDGFRATTFSETDFYKLTENLENEVTVFEVDNSSVFCEIIA